LVVGSLCSGYLLYASVRDIVAYGGLPLLTVRAAYEGPGVSGPVATPLPSPTPAPQRMNILLLGSDEREEAQGAARTDTMILCSIDPAAKTVTMLSIPRDLWLPLPPGFSRVREDRINTAYLYGELYKYPGGGPALAKEAVQYNLGVPVQYYARIDFAGFRRIIDEVGGIDVDVPRDITDTAYPAGGDEVMTIHFDAGRQHMDGDQALKYARTRHDSNDIDRAHRQQQVIMAVRSKVLSLDIPITHIPAMLRILGSSVQTDLSLDKILTAAQVVRSAQQGGIRQGVIDETMTTPWLTPGGADVLLPQRDKIRQLIEELFVL